MSFRPRFSVHILMCLLIVLSLVSSLAAQDGSFAIIGDTRIGSRTSMPTYLEMLRQIEAAGVTTIVNVGDAIDSAGRQDQWELFLQTNAKERNVYVAPGNHDVDNRKSLQTFEQMLGRPPYYSVEANGALFVFLNSELPGETGRITGEQFKWLANELKKDVRHRFVFLHKPVFPSIYGTNRGLDRYREERDRLHALFVENRVSLVAAGHEHLYNRTTKDGITYVITGGGGAKLHVSSPAEGGFHHYVIAKKFNEGYLFTVRDINGNARDSFSIK